MTEDPSLSHVISRRRFLKGFGAGIFISGLQGMLPLPAWALASPRSLHEGLAGYTPQAHFDLAFNDAPLIIDGKQGRATAINGTVPAPLLRWREGSEVTLDVTNHLEGVPHASLHWHGVLVPPGMDGVPGLSFEGIPPGKTYRYRFAVKQAGTYWYHSHSRFQEQSGAYGPIIIDPKRP